MPALYIDVTAGAVYEDGRPQRSVVQQSVWRKYRASYRKLSSAAHRQRAEIGVAAREEAEAKAGALKSFLPFLHFSSEILRLVKNGRVQVGVWPPSR